MNWFLILIYSTVGKIMIKSLLRILKAKKSFHTEIGVVELEKKIENSV